VLAPNIYRDSALFAEDTLNYGNINIVDYCRGEVTSPLLKKIQGRETLPLQIADAKQRGGENLKEPGIIRKGRKILLTFS